MKTYGWTYEVATEYVFDNTNDPDAPTSIEELIVGLEHIKANLNQMKIDMCSDIVKVLNA